MFCLCFVACDPSSYHFNYDELSDNVISVELINYNNPEQKRFNSNIQNNPKLKPFSFENMIVLETLNEKDFDDFFMQLSNVYFLYKYYVFNSPKDVCIRLVYSSSDFDVLSCDYENNSFGGYVGKYDSKGNAIDFHGSFEDLSDFKALVNDFFETQIN
jgi:hypothetical protein